MAKRNSSTKSVGVADVMAVVVELKAEIAALRDELKTVRTKRAKSQEDRITALKKTQEPIIKKIRDKGLKLTPSGASEVNYQVLNGDAKVGFLQGNQFQKMVLTLNEDTGNTVKTYIPTNLDEFLKGIKKPRSNKK